VARVDDLVRAREEKTNQSTALAIKETGLSKAWVLERLRENVERSMQAKPVLDKEGQPTGEYRYEAAAANRALELIGKEIGMFVDRQEVSFEQRIAMMTDEQRLEEAGRLAERIRAKLDQHRHLIDVTPEVEE
jgi:hypothetical protein